MSKETLHSEIVIVFNDLRDELVEVMPDAANADLRIIAAILVLARELNFLRQDLEGRN
jgi:hypothetical protein